ncbi:MAG: hypothetical protein EBS82_06600 [Methylocystaceae bacterium]|nr:hypothetical protein [Methylocystaceae bacterium]
MFGAAHATELFYEGCEGSSCSKSFILKKTPERDGVFLVKVMLVKYREKNSTNATEDTSTAKVDCNRNIATVTWENQKASKIDRSIFAKPLKQIKVRKGKLGEPEPEKVYDETTSLWKRVCPAN